LGLYQFRPIALPFAAQGNSHRKSDSRLDAPDPKLASDLPQLSLQLRKTGWQRPPATQIEFGREIRENRETWEAQSRSTGVEDRQSTKKNLRTNK